MRRFAAFDPPEYVTWVPTPDLVRAFRATLEGNAERAAIVSRLPNAARLALYGGLLRARLLDIQLKRWVRAGILSKAWLATGEEAATVGPVHALARGRDVAAPMIRNAAACAELGMPLADVFRTYLGTADGPSRGRDLHAGDLTAGVLQPVSHVGDMVPVIAGIALAFKVRGEPRVALTWVGDGSTKTAAAHEGTNFAAVQRLPAVFIIQNNQVALGTRLEQHHLPPDFRDWPASYGMWGAAFDGNNVLDAYAATALAVERCRRGEGPVMLTAETFRMGGHATHDEAEARATIPHELFKAWGTRDPVGLYEEYLKEDGRSPAELEEVEAMVTAEIEEGAATALASRNPAPAGASALGDVYVR
ncbi:MAG TPA: thiamine pyrophosphate-dependent dehydrogenase E1 component subunit alpha [Gemmatimonadales bacterium]|nr:thiamine pyrophosphate-dependent dehydrogenase E1 component subunit alpha [Gemmatimonadales bacterium]